MIQSAFYKLPKVKAIENWRRRDVIFVGESEDKFAWVLLVEFVSNEYLILVNTVGSTTLWDVNRLQKIKELRFSWWDYLSWGHNIRDLAYSRSANLFGVACLESGCRIWEVPSGRRKAKIESKGIISLSFSPDGKRVAIGETNGYLSLQALGDQKKLWEVKAYGHSGVGRVRFSRDGKNIVTVASCGKEVGIIKIWNTMTENYIVENEPSENLLKFSKQMEYAIPISKFFYFVTGNLTLNPKSSMLAVISKIDSVDIIDLVNLKNIKSLTPHSGFIIKNKEGAPEESKIVSAITWTPDGAYLVMGALPHSIQFWDTHSWEMVELIDLSKDHKPAKDCGIFTISLPYFNGPLSDEFVTAQTSLDLKQKSGIYSIAFSPDGQVLVASCGCGYLHVLEKLSTNKLKIKEKDFLVLREKDSGLQNQK